MAVLTLCERWTGVLSPADGGGEAICGRPLRLTVRMQLGGWRSLRADGWLLNGEIEGLTPAGVLTVQGRISLSSGSLRYALGTPDHLSLLGTRRLVLRGFPPPLTVMSATIRNAGQLHGRATLRFDVRTELSRMLSGWRAERAR